MYLLCSANTDGTFAPLGSAVAISCPSNQYLLTAFHNLSKTPVIDSSIKFVVMKKLTVRGPPGSVFEVLKKSGNFVADWAVLKIKDESQHFEETISLRPKSQFLPQPHDETTLLKLFYYPASITINDTNPILQAHSTEFMKVQDVNPRYIPADLTRLNLPQPYYGGTVVLSQGMMKGASGGPLLDKNHCVVALHIDSFNEGEEYQSTGDKSEDNAPETRNADRLTALHEWASQPSTYHSSRTGRIIFNIDEVIATINPQPPRYMTRSSIA